MDRWTGELELVMMREILRGMVPARVPADVEVVIPAMNAEHAVRNTLDSLVPYLAAWHRQATVVVIDFGGVDGTADVVSASRASGVDVLYRGCARPNLVVGLRRAVLDTVAAHVAIWDPAVLTDPASLDRALMIAERDRRTVVGPRVPTRGGKGRNPSAIGFVLMTTVLARGFLREAEPHSMIRLKHLAKYGSVAGHKPHHMAALSAPLYTQAKAQARR